MPRNGSSVYSPPAGTKGVPNTTILSNKFNGWVDDVAQTFNTLQPIVLGGTGASTADGAAKALGLVSAKDMAGVNTVGGTANAITIATDRVYTALTNTLFLRFRAQSNIAGGGMTINLDGIGAKPVKKVVAAGQVDVNAGDIIGGGYYDVGYDPASDNGEGEDGAFILHNPGNASSAYQVGDFFDTARTLNSDWLRRDGALYDSSDYPELSEILPPLPDGIAWSDVPHSLTGIIWGEIFGSDFYVICAGSNSTLVYKSTDFQNFSLQATISGINGFRIYKFGSTLVITGANNSGNVLSSSSTDGASWTSPVAVGSLTGQGCVMAWNGSLYVAGGSGGTILTSPDLATWTARTSGTTQIISDIKWLNSNFLALANTTVVTSTDGLTWTVRTTGASRPLQRVAYGAGVYVAAGGDGTGNVLITSPNLTTWTPRNPLTSENLRGGITFSSSGFLLLGDTGVARISADGLTWTASPSGTTDQFVNATFNPNQQNVYYALTVGSKIRKGIRTLPTQFATPDDNPTYGWIKAVS